MSNSFRNALLLAAALIFISSTFAQEWSAEQKEVWSSIETYWDLAQKGDADGFLSYFDESYVGWSNRSAIPSNKSTTSKFIRWDLKNNKTLLYSVTPASIWVKGEFAYAHYFFTTLEQDKAGKETWSSGRWTDILMKKGNKWVLVGDHGGRTQSAGN